jgi:hypothetical protein
MVLSRELAALMVLVVGVFSSSGAVAATSIDLFFHGSGNSVTSITPGFDGTLHMSIFLTSDDGLTAASVSIAWDNAATDAVAPTGEWLGIAVAFNMTTGAPTAYMAPAVTGPAGAFIDNDARIIYAFDGAIPQPNNPANLPASSYMIGSVTWYGHTQPIPTNISAVILPGIDGFYVGDTDISDTVSLGTAHFGDLVPEPSTGLLVGVGLIAIALRARRNQGP